MLVLRLREGFAVERGVRCDARDEKMEKAIAAHYFRKRFSRTAHGKRNQRTAMFSGEVGTQSPATVSKRLATSPDRPRRLLLLLLLGFVELPGRSGAGFDAEARCSEDRAVLLLLRSGAARAATAAAGRALRGVLLRLGKLGRRGLLLLQLA